MQSDALQSDIPAIIIAAGASKRLGQPKSLLPLGNQTLIQWSCNRLSREGFHPIIVTRVELYDQTTNVLGDKIVIVNQQPERGRTSSIQTGLQHIINANLNLANGVLIVPVDRPGWPNGVLQALAECDTSSCLAFDGRKGHPVFIHPSDVDKLLTCHASLPLRDCIEFSSFDVHAPFLQLNIDSEDDVKMLNCFYDEMQNSSSKYL
ncbi:MAG: NTP transferase domain-containing protein [Candidatus Poseidoniales archaeon]